MISELNEIDRNLQLSTDTLDSETAELHDLSAVNLTSDESNLRQALVVQLGQTDQRILSEEDTALQKVRETLNLQDSYNTVTNDKGSDDTSKERDELISNATAAIEGLMKLQGATNAKNTQTPEKKESTDGQQALSTYYDSLANNLVAKEQDTDIAEKLDKATATAKELINQALKGEEPQNILISNKYIDFLSTFGKLASILLAVTPLPTFLGVWGKPKAEQIKRVESVGFMYLLLLITNCSIWTSYSFKI